jgi:hypothetical protein
VKTWWNFQNLVKTWWISETWWKPGDFPRPGEHQVQLIEETFYTLKFHQKKRFFIFLVKFIRFGGEIEGKT